MINNNAEETVLFEPLLASALLNALYAHVTFTTTNVYGGDIVTKEETDTGKGLSLLI